MPLDSYFSRPLPPSGLIVPVRSSPTLIASLGRLPAGSYLLFAKVIVVTRVDDSGRDSARADFSLEAGGRVDKAMCALWHSSDWGALQPADTVSLQLAATIRGPVRRGPAAVRLFCTSIMGVLELRDLVITAIKVDTIKDIT